MDLSFSFETIFIIYVIILNTLIIVATLGLEQLQRDNGIGIWFIANLFFVIFPIVAINYYL